MKVYVITRGEYSDYHICGVTLEKEKAKQVAEMMHKNSDMYVYREIYIEEYETDMFDAFLRGGKAWHVWYKHSGELHAKLYSDSYVDYVDYNEVTENHYSKRYEVYVVAKDEEHAKKIGKDLIMQYIAEMELDKPENRNW